MPRGQLLGPHVLGALVPRRHLTGLPLQAGALGRQEQVGPPAGQLLHVQLSLPHACSASRSDPQVCPRGGRPV